MLELSPVIPAAQNALEAIGWVDLTAASVIVVFSILGIFKGLVWQLSRIGTLVGAYILAALYGPDVGEWMFHGSLQGADERLPLYIAYVSIFVAVLVVLSLVALLVTKLVEKTGLTFYNRMGGGVLGVGTGAMVVVFLLGLVFMFAPEESGVVAAAKGSRSADYSKRVVEIMGTLVPEGVREAFGAEPAGAAGSEGR